jgi:hypothetical protein
MFCLVARTSRRNAHNPTTCVPSPGLKALTASWMAYSDKLDTSFDRVGR